MNRRMLSHAIVLLLMLGACTPTYYKPNAMNVPLLAGTEKGSVAVNSDFNRTFNFSGAVSPTEKVSVTAGFSFVTEDDHNGNLLEFGVGYTDRLFAEKVYGELFLGYGVGTVQTYRDAAGTKFFTRGDIGRASLQPAIGYRLNEYFEAAVAGRLVYLTY